jgi:DNA polymerase-3 subunit epsilon
MRAASADRRYERAAWLRRRHARMRTLLARLGGMMRAVHAGSRLVLAAHPSDPARRDAFWVVGGRVVDWGPLPDDPAELASRTAEALRAAPRPERGGWLLPEEIAEARIIGLWLAAHDTARVRELRPGAEDQRALADWVSGGVARAA